MKYQIGFTGYSNGIFSTEFITVEAETKVKARIKAHHLCMLDERSVFHIVEIEEQTHAQPF